MAAVRAAQGPPEATGLDPAAVGFWSGLAIALDSTAPAYSLAAVIGLVVAEAGFQAPAVLLLAFVPICLTSLAYAALNRVEPDCGTTFAWVRRAMGPGPGWVAGWLVTATGVLVVGSLAEVAAQHAYLLVGWDAGATSTPWLVTGAVVVIALATAVAVRGTQLTAAVQCVLVVVQVVVLAGFAIWALAEGGAATPSPSWADPTAVPSAGALAAGLTIAVFAYWGWESALSLNEETRDAAVAPGRAGVLATVLLLGTYVLVAYAVLAHGGLEGAAAFEDDPGILAAYADAVLPGALDELVVLAVLTSGLASTQTTILPASRTTLSMARRGALPAAFGRVHPRFRTPVFGTVTIAVAAVAAYVPLRAVSAGNFLFDAITALGVLIAAYYALTAFAAVVLLRRRLRRSARDALVLGVLPTAGGLALTWLLVETLRDTADPDASYSGTAVLGMGLPFVLGVGLLLAGVLGALLWRATGHRAYFAARPEVLPPT